MEVLTSLPGLILLAFILATTGPGLRNLLVGLALAFLLPRGVRMVRNCWVAALPERALWLRLVGIALGVLILSTGLAVITQPVLGFLGLGAHPPSPDLGAMLVEPLTANVRQGEKDGADCRSTLLLPGRVCFVGLWSGDLDDLAAEPTLQCPGDGPG